MEPRTRLRVVNLLPFQPSVYPNDQWALRDWLNRLGFGQGSMETYVMIEMNRAVANEFTYVRREEPGVQPPAQPLINRSDS